MTDKDFELSIEVPAEIKSAIDGLRRVKLGSRSAQPRGPFTVDEIAELRARTARYRRYAELVRDAKQFDGF